MFENIGLQLFAEESAPAANADAGSAPEGVAAPQQAANAAPEGAEGFASPGTTEQNPAQNPARKEPEGNPESITQTQAFARRLREEVERARQEAAQAAREEYQKERDRKIAEKGYVWNGKPIKTEAEYEQALREQQLMERYREQGLPEDVIRKLAKVDEIERRLREADETRSREQQAMEAEARRKNMFGQFLKDFPDYASEDKWKAIPPEVFAEADKWLKSKGMEGRNLSDAMTNYLFRQSMKQQQAQAANAQSAGASTGSVKSTGPVTGDYISREVFEQNRNNQDWVLKNYETLKKSMNLWGKK